MKGKMKKVLALCLVLAGCAGLAAAEETPDLLPAAGMQTDTARVTRGDYYVPQMYDAFVAPYAEILSMNISGEVKEVFVKSGDQVKAGQMLISLDLDSTREKAETLREEIAYAQAQNEMNNHLSEIDLAMLENELAELLYLNADAKAVALKKLEIEQKELDIRHDREMQELNLQDQENALEKLEEILKNDGIYAPFDGQIANVLTLMPGDRINAFSPVIVLADLSRLHISVEYISDFVWSLATGGAVARIGSREYKTERMPIDRDAYLAAAMRGEKFYCGFELLDTEDAGEPIEAGMYCALILLNDYHEDQLLIPANAVMNDGGGSYVYRVGENGEYVHHYVKTRKSSGSVYAMVLDGLEEGDLIYVTDQ